MTKITDFPETLFKKLNRVSESGSVEVVQPPPNLNGANGRTNEADHKTGISNVSIAIFEQYSTNQIGPLFQLLERKRKRKEYLLYGSQGDITTDLKAANVVQGEISILEATVSAFVLLQSSYRKHVEQLYNELQVEKEKSSDLFSRLIREIKISTDLTMVMTDLLVNLNKKGHAEL